MMPNNQTHSDPDLIRRALTGNRLAYQSLVERHRNTVLAVARQALGNADDAQDVAQETWMYAYQHLHGVRDRTHIAAWLRTVTLTLCADYRRRRGTRRLGEPIAVLNEAMEDRDYASSLAIRQAVSHLSEAHQSVILLHYLGGWSQDEVAGLTGVPLNTVRSRLRTAKANLRTHLDGFFQDPFEQKGTFMSANTFGLSETHTALIDVAFPGARIVSVQNDPEPWMPFGPRVRIALKDGAMQDVDFRTDIDPSRTALLSVLKRLGIPGPRLIHGPVSDGASSLSLCEVPQGDNLILWTLGGTPHRIRIATERAFEGIDRLQSITSGLQADPVGAKLERRTLAYEVAILMKDDRWNADPWLAEAGLERTQWLQDPWFLEALTAVKAAVAEIDDPLVYTHYAHFLPLSYRLMPSVAGNPLAEVVNPFGHFGDPLLGLAMVWVQDCYPFVHTGFVEQFLWCRGVTKREFAPRLALKALQMTARDVPVKRPTEGGEYWDSLRDWVEMAMSWM